LKYLIVLPVAGLLILSHTVLAQEESLSCHQITDPGERLACYDRAFQDGPTESGKREVSPSVESKTVTEKPPADSPVISQKSSATSSADQPAVATSRGLFSAKDKLNINSRLVSVRDKDKQKMVFRLENEQIWLQDSPRSLPFRKGDEVTIKSATIGGYILSNQKGVSTRVRQIK
jgi:hypothetical protein